MPERITGTRPQGARAFREGKAEARLAGLPVETLRVWERRYELSEARRSAHGQRLYMASQVQRLGLLKQLVDQGLIAEADLELFTFVETAEEAWAALDAHYGFSASEGKGRHEEDV